MYNLLKDKLRITQSPNAFKKKNEIIKKNYMINSTS